MSEVLATQSPIEAAQTDHDQLAEWQNETLTDDDKAAFAELVELNRLEAKAARTVESASGKKVEVHDIGSAALLGSGIAHREFNDNWSINNH